MLDADARGERELLVELRRPAVLEEKEQRVSGCRRLERAARTPQGVRIELEAVLRSRERLTVVVLDRDASRDIEAARVPGVRELRPVAKSMRAAEALEEVRHVAVEPDAVALVVEDLGVVHALEPSGPVRREARCVEIARL